MDTGLASFARFCSSLTTESGKPMKLRPYQRTLLKDYFRGARETVIILPKKNGKTTLLGALALYHLITVPNAECVIAAASRDQARILFKQAAGIVHRSPRLKETLEVRPGYGEIRLAVDDEHTMGARIRVLAADSTTADGVIPTLALVDELHRHPSAELYGVFRDGLGPRQGQLITISTAGASMESPLGELRANAYRLPSFTRSGAYNYARSQDRSFVLHEWCLEAGDDVSDLKLVKRANPAPWHTLKSLRERRDSPSTTPAQWARFACGVWMDTKAPYVSAEEWEACDDPIPDLEGRICYGGLDLSATTDTTAFVLAFPIGDQMVVKPYVFLPEEGLARRIARDKAPYDTWANEGLIFLTPGSVVDYGFVRQTIIDAAKDYDLRTIGYDRWNASQLTNELRESEGMDMAPVAQGFKVMAQPMQDFKRLVMQRKLIHGDHPVLRRHVLSMAVQQDPEGNVKPAKTRSTGRIDAAAALLNALVVAAGTDEAPKVSAYESQLCRCSKRHPVPHIWRDGCERLASTA